MRVPTLGHCMVSRVLAGTLCAVVLSACAEKSTLAKATPTDGTSALHASLAFLEDGKTTKEDVRTRLGPPSGEFDQGKIWTYSRLDAAHHLVVVFGEQDLVKMHRIVKIK